MVDVHVEQIPPVHRHGVVGSHQWVIDYLMSHPAVTDVNLYERAVVLLRQREQLGLARYGTLLQPGNGRDAIRDAWEETVDQVVYLATAIREGHQVHAIFAHAIDVMLELIAYMR